MHFKSSLARCNKCIRHLEEETDCFCSCGWYFPCRPQCEEIITKNYLLPHPIASSASPSLSECVSASVFVWEERRTCLWRRGRDEGGREGDRGCINLSAFITASGSSGCFFARNIKRFSKLKGQFTQLLKHSFIFFAQIVETSASFSFLAPSSLKRSPCIILTALKRKVVQIKVYTLLCSLHPFCTAQVWDDCWNKCSALLQLLLQLFIFIPRQRFAYCLLGLSHKIHLVGVWKILCFWIKILVVVARNMAWNSPEVSLKISLKKKE